MIYYFQKKNKPIYYILIQFTETKSATKYMRE